MSITDNLNTIFDVEVLPETEQLPVEVKEIQGELLAANKSHDIALARQTLVDLIGKSTDLLDECITLAKESQQPRAAEVSAALIKTISEVAKDLISVHEPKARQGSKQPVQETTNQSQTNIFVGTTADLQKLIKETGV